jgi:hypothetical protein
MITWDSEIVYMPNRAVRDHNLIQERLFKQFVIANGENESAEKNKCASGVLRCRIKNGGLTHPEIYRISCGGYNNLRQNLPHPWEPLIMTRSLDFELRDGHK